MTHSGQLNWLWRLSCQSIPTLWIILWGQLHKSYFGSFHRRHERLDQQRYGSSPMLMEQRCGSERGSHPDIYGDCGRFRHEMSPVGCCSYHMPPPCCFFSDNRGYHWPPSYSPKVVIAEKTNFSVVKATNYNILYLQYFFTKFILHISSWSKAMI